MRAMLSSILALVGSTSAWSATVYAPNHSIYQHTTAVYTPPQVQTVDPQIIRYPDGRVDVVPGQVMYTAPQIRVSKPLHNQSNDYQTTTEHTVYMLDGSSQTERTRTYHQPTHVGYPSYPQPVYPQPYYPPAVVVPPCPPPVVVAPPCPPPVVVAPPAVGYPDPYPVYRGRAHRRGYAHGYHDGYTDGRYDRPRCGILPSLGVGLYIGIND